MREGELFGVAIEDFDFAEKIVRIRRQIKRLDDVYVFALSKDDRERIIPLSDWAIRVVRRHIEKFPPRLYALPWEKPTGKPHMCSLLFWKPALVKAGVIAEPVKDRRSRRRYATTRRLSTSFATTTPASCTLAAFPSRSSPSISVIMLLRSPCVSTLICCQAPTTAHA